MTHHTSGGVATIMLTALLTFAGCGGDAEVPTERADGGTLPTDDPDGMTAEEHAEAACDEIEAVLRDVAAGNVGVHGDQLDYIISHAGAADDEALDEAANTWADGTADGDARAVDAAAQRLARLC